jgi:sugar/nucleoside kinase (ribokinase family)
MAKPELPGGEHSIAIIGHLAIDSIIHPKFEIPRSPGGSAAAIATAAVQLGIKTSIYSKVGKDFPKEWLEVLEALGVDISRVEISERVGSLSVKITYDEKGALKGIECNDKAYEGLSFETLPRADCVHICPLEPKYQAELVQSMKGHTDILSISFQEFFSKDYRKTDFFDMMDWEAVDIVFANEREAKALTKKRKPENMAQKLNNEGIGVVVITLGKKGSIVYDGKDMHNISARDVEVVDPTGCGDSYIGGFLGQYLVSKDVQKAAGIGTYLASLTAQKKGSWAALMSDVGVRF